MSKFEKVTNFKISIFIYLWIIMEFKATYVSWSNIEEWTLKIRDMLVENNFKPEIIIGIARGGLVPARMVSDYLLIKDLLSIKTEHWGLTATMDGKAILAEKLNYNLKGKKVLLVDDITDTGESMKVAYEYVKSLNPEEVKTASMLYINSSSYVPDYYGEKITRDNWAWFIFPWNVYEDTYNLSKKILDSPKSLDSISNFLKDNYNVNIEAIDLNAVLRDLARIGLLKYNKDMFSI